MDGPNPNSQTDRNIRFIFRLFAVSVYIFCDNFCGGALHNRISG